MKSFIAISILFLSACGANDSTLSLGTSKGAAGNAAAFDSLTHAVFLSSTRVSMDANNNVIPNAVQQGALLLTSTAFSCAELQAIATRNPNTYIENANAIIIGTVDLPSLTIGAQTIYASEDLSRPDSPVISAFGASQLCRNGTLIYQDELTSGTLDIESLTETPASVTGSISTIISGTQAAKIKFNAPVCEIGLKDVTTDFSRCWP